MNHDNPLPVLVPIASASSKTNLELTYLLQIKKIEQPEVESNEVGIDAHRFSEKVLSEDKFRLAVDYANLMIKNNPSEEDNEAIMHIVEAAVEDEVLDFWIAEAEHVVLYTQGLLSAEKVHLYTNEQYLIYEHLTGSESLYEMPVKPVQEPASQSDSEVGSDEREDDLCSLCRS